MKIPGCARVTEKLRKVGDRSVPMLEWLHPSSPDMVCRFCDVNLTHLELGTAGDVQLVWL